MMGVCSSTLMTRLMVKRLSITRVVVTLARYRNRAKITEPPTSVSTKGTTIAINMHSAKLSI